MPEQDAYRTAVLLSDTFKPTMEAARQAALDGVPGALAEEMAEFSAFVGPTKTNPRLLAAVAERTNDAILHDWSRLGKQTRDKVANTVAGNIATGQGPQLLAQRLSQVADFPRWRANTIARTEYMSASDMMNVGQFQANGIQKYVWEAGPGCCVICGVLHGGEFSATELPGRHPNCRCAMIPKVAGVSMPEPGGVYSAEQTNAMLPKRLQQPNPTSASLQDTIVLTDNPNWKPAWALQPA
jgi:SPP1 gp7 family putative phage head morphogenesis protein